MMQHEPRRRVVSGTDGAAMLSQPAVASLLAAFEHMESLVQMRNVDEGVDHLVNLLRELRTVRTYLTCVSTGTDIRANGRTS